MDNGVKVQILRFSNESKNEIRALLNCFKNSVRIYAQEISINELKYDILLELCFQVNVLYKDDDNRYTKNIKYTNAELGLCSNFQKKYN